ncbi:MAG TPA: hypothetical protein VMU92_10580 [Acidobacteriaceae bacterium]|nr:hypothetical protein [Acidobacteriaceae bacterium]
MEKGEDHAILTAEVSSGENQEQGEGGQQEGGFEGVPERCAASVIPLDADWAGGGAGRDSDVHNLGCKVPAKGAFRRVLRLQSMIFSSFGFILMYTGWLPDL